MCCTVTAKQTDKYSTFQNIEKIDSASIFFLIKLEMGCFNVLILDFTASKRISGSRIDETKLIMLMATPH